MSLVVEFRKPAFEDTAPLCGTAPWVAALDYYVRRLLRSSDYE